MIRWRQWLARLGEVARRPQLEADLDDELTFHLESEAERLEREDGLSPSEARRRPGAISPFEAAVSQRRADYERLVRQLDDLAVKSTMTGLLQIVSVEVGQQVTAGTNLVRVSDPTRLKADVRVPETQARELVIGQSARVDTRYGVIDGYVSRIDPASQGGTVGIDIALTGDLPVGARPDLTVDATVELERLPEVLFVESPTTAQENGTLRLFRVTEAGELARTSVRIGRRSVRFVEVVEGLVEGDRVVLSDMSAYDAFDRLRLQ